MDSWLSHTELPFELDRADIIQHLMQPAGIVKSRKVFEHVAPCLVPVTVDVPEYQLIEEALDTGIVVAVSLWERAERFEVDGADAAREF